MCLFNRKVVRCLVYYFSLNLFAPDNDVSNINTNIFRVIVLSLKLYFFTCSNKISANGQQLPHGNANWEPDDWNLAKMSHIAKKCRHCADHFWGESNIWGIQSTRFVHHIRHIVFHHICHIVICSRYLCCFLTASSSSTSDILTCVLRELTGLSSNLIYFYPNHRYTFDLLLIMALLGLHQSYI